MSVVALWSPADLLLGVFAPLAVAASRSPSLVVDLDPRGPSYPATFTLADLVANGPTRQQLEPPASGTHILPNGGVEMGVAEETLSALVDRWPNVVLRCPPYLPAPSEAIGILPLLPEPFAIKPTTRYTLFQDVGLLGLKARSPEVLPPPKARTLAALARLEVPVRSRWVRSLRPVWGTS